MRIVKFQDVLRGAAESTGRIFDSLSNDEFALFRGFISRRLREAWESEYWPELMQVESRTYDTSGDIKYISHTQSNKTEIGQVYRILNKDPRVAHNWIEYDWQLHALGVVVIDGPETPYVEFRKRAPELTGSDWLASSDYIVGEQVYDNGDFWNVKVARDGTDDGGNAGTTGDPRPSADYVVNGETNWDLVEIPYIFKPWLEKAAAGDMLLLDEKPDLAMVQHNMAKEALDIESIKIYRQQSQTSRIKFKTY